METIAIPIFGNRISPRLDYTESMQLITVENGVIKGREILKLLSSSRFEKINTIVKIKPNVIICDGVSDLSYDKLIANNIKVYPWIHGEVDIILKKFVDGNLKQTDINK